MVLPAYFLVAHQDEDGCLARILYVAWDVSSAIESIISLAWCEMKPVCRLESRSLSDHKAPYPFDPAPVPAYWLMTKSSVRRVNDDNVPRTCKSNHHWGGLICSNFPSLAHPFVDIDQIKSTLCDKTTSSHQLKVAILRAPSLFILARFCGYQRG